jgi:hypothetical protein
VHAAANNRRAACCGRLAAAGRYGVGSVFDRSADGISRRSQCHLAEIFTAFVITNVAGVVVLLVARGTMRPLAQVADTLDAIVYAELVSVTPLQPARGEIARLERDDEVVEVTVLDIGEGGALIDIVENVAIGDHVVLTFLGVKAITAEAVRSGGDGFGICFKPACLRLEDLCDLVTSQERAA